MRRPPLPEPPPPPPGRTLGGSSIWSRKKKVDPEVQEKEIRKKTKNLLMDIIKSDPDLFQEVIVELRRMKIKNIVKKK